MARHERHNYPHLLTRIGGKFYAATRDEARRLRREVVGFKGHDNPVRAYECDSGGWRRTQPVERTRAQDGRTRHVRAALVHHIETI